MSISDLFYPRTCFGCKKPGQYFCGKCIRKVERALPSCPTCQNESPNGVTHARCKTPLGLDGLISPWEYDKAIRKGLLSLRYKFAKDVAGELIEKMFNRLDTRALPKKALLVSVPLSSKRKKWRGFNQAEDLGRLIAQKAEWKFAPELLIKRRKTPSQTTLKGKARRKNLRGAFVVNTAFSEGILNNHLVVFDDVWATGTTLRECARVLKKAGAKKVWAMTVAVTR